MPRTTQRQITAFSGWLGGLNRDASELQLAIDESPELLNVDIDRRGGFKPRDGYLQVVSASNPTDTYQLLASYEPSSGTDRAIGVTEAGDIWDGAAYTSMTDTTKSFGVHGNLRNWPIEAVVLDDQIYLFSLRGNTWRYNGTTWTEITDSTLDESGVAATPEAPQAKTAVTHLSRIFVGNIKAGGTAHRSRLAWSETPIDNGGDAAGNRWKALSFIDVDQDDGTEITKIASFQSNLIIFKHHSLHVLAGVDEASFTLYPVDDDVGTVSPGSVAFDESNLFFFDRDQGVYVFDGVKTTRIDHAINEYILDGMKYNQSYKAEGFMSDGKYHLAVPWGTDNYNSRMFVFDPLIAAWTEYDYGVFSHSVFGGVEYTGGNRDLVGTYSWRAGDTLDEATAISWHLETAWVPEAANQGMTNHRLRRVDLLVEIDSSTFNIDLYVDGVDSQVWTQSVTADKNRVRLPGYEALWERIKFRIYGVTT
jgi:hypothetical protein